MFDTVDEIYNHIGQTMFNQLPDEWESAYLEVILHQVDVSISIGPKYMHEGEVFNFDLDVINGVYKSSKCSKAFYALYKIMQKNEEDVPWNKARFEITSEGDFSIDFKYDEDFAYLNSLDPDKDEYPSSDDILAIETWEGLPETAPRYWKNK